MLEKPIIHPDAVVVDNATIRGAVTLEEKTTVLFGAVLRAEHDTITIRRGSNIQDNCVLHVDKGFPMMIGENCTVGHGAILHGCTVGENTLIGMGAIVLNGAVIGSNCIVGAGALVTQNTVIPDGSLVLGSPARVKRSLTEAEIAKNRAAADSYLHKRELYRE